MILTGVNATSFSRLLVRLPNWVGDIMMALPALRSLRVTFPHARLIGMVRPDHVELVRRIDALDEVMPAPPRRSRGRLRAMATAIGEIRAKNLDAAVLFAPSFEAALTVRLAGVPIRVGHATDHRSVMLNRPVSVRKVHQSDVFQDVVSELGGEPADSGGGLRLTDDDRSFASNLLETAERRPDTGPVFLNPASTKIPRAWASDRFRTLAERLTDRFPETPILVHDRHPFEQPAGWPTSDSIRTVTGASLTQLAGVIDRCSLYVGNDSGPIHIAAALGVPTVGIYGPTSPTLTSPRGAIGAVHVSVSAQFECSPCRERFFEECPSQPTPDKRPPCLNEVSVETVVEAAREVLERNADLHPSPAHDAGPTNHVS
jgi:ADP-heptose:LPS heptosyltransferase